MVAWIRCALKLSSLAYFKCFTNKHVPYLRKARKKSKHAKGTKKCFIIGEQHQLRFRLLLFCNQTTSRVVYGFRKCESQFGNITKQERIFRCQMANGLVSIL